MAKTHPKTASWLPLCPLQSTASLASSVASFSDEPTLDCGIRLAPDTPLSKARVLDLHPTQLAVGMQQVRRSLAGWRHQQALTD